MNFQYLPATVVNITYIYYLNLNFFDVLSCESLTLSLKQLLNIMQKLEDMYVVCAHSHLCELE